MDDIEKLLEQFATVAPAKRRSIYDYNKVVEYARKQKRFISVGEVAKALGIPYNYVRQFLERKSVDVDKAKELLKSGDVESRFVKYNSAYLLLEHLVEK